jgi:hypothetical protein
MVMDVSKKDADKMRRLAGEGKTIAKIQREDFPDHDYWDVYLEVYASGQRSAQGVKKMITSRLNQLADADKATRQGIIEELHGLVWHLYENHKGTQKTLRRIRQALGE